MHVNGHLTEFKLDTGAEVTVLGGSSPILNDTALLSTNQILRGTDGAELPVAEYLNCTLAVADQQVKETVYVLKGKTTALPGKRACEALGLVTVSSAVYEVQHHSADATFRQQFPEPFEILGKCGDPYDIQLHSEAKPHCL